MNTSPRALTAARARHKRAQLKPRSITRLQNFCSRTRSGAETSLPKVRPAYTARSRLPFEPRPAQHHCFGVLKRHDVDVCRKNSITNRPHLHDFHQPISGCQTELLLIGLEGKRKEERVWRTTRGKPSCGPLDAHV